jgi:hypothetical protein
MLSPAAIGLHLHEGIDAGVSMSCREIANDAPKRMPTPAGTRHRK